MGSTKNHKSAPPNSDKVFLADTDATPIPPGTAAIFLMGKTGVGKSSFIKSLGGREMGTGKKPVVHDGIDSCTSKPTAYATVIDNTPTILVDTPGFDDSAKENLELIYDLIAYLHRLTLGKVNVHGVVFLHDISQVRYDGSQQKTFSILKAIVGEESMGNVIIGTTMWSPTSLPRYKKEEKRAQDIKMEHWGGIRKTIQLFDEDKDVATSIAADLLAKPPALLLAQKEMLKPPHSIERTTVGSILIPEGIRELEKAGSAAGALKFLIDKVSKPMELSFVEKLGLAIVAPIVLAPAALISAPVGVVAALVHLAKKAGA